MGEDLDNANGEVICRPDLTMLDTREMHWLPFDGLPGAQIKVLSEFDSGGPEVFLLWIPPGISGTADSAEKGGKYRHAHKTVREFTFVLAGELPYWEYETPDQQAGDKVTFRSGYYMDRRPGSIHGVEPGALSPVGCLLLGWRTGPGTFALEEDFKHESYVV